MSTYAGTITENKTQILTDSLSGLYDDAIHHASHNRALKGTIALLSQTQNELENSRRQIEDLKNQLIELERVATTDILTGLKNRRGFEEVFASEMDKTRRGKSSGGVLVVIDLDSFKAINDTYGHKAGDACLKLVGKTLTNEIRGMDTACRLGGDEFVLLMTEATQDVLLTRVQNIAWVLNHLTLEWEGASIHINASVGMKPYTANDTPESVFEDADHTMYDNKKRTKN